MTVFKTINLIFIVLVQCLKSVYIYLQYLAEGAKVNDQLKNSLSALDKVGTVACCLSLITVKFDDKATLFLVQKVSGTVKPIWRGFCITGTPVFNINSHIF